MRKRDLADVAVIWTITSVPSLMHDEVGALVKHLVASLECANIEGTLSLGYLVAGQYALAGLRVDLVYTTLLALACLIFASIF